MGKCSKYTLPETNSEFTPENRWLEYYFPIGARPIFRCKLAVSFGAPKFHPYGKLVDNFLLAEKRGGSLVFLGYIGDEILPSYMGIIINFIIRIPIKQPGFNGTYFFHGSPTPWKLGSDGLTNST